ncbi:CinA family protein [Brachybacterium sp. AOP25-B2-12]|uniref:CinA family protein n=1 Tax=Brachybacterium sp. AOP25-B2-12 TaxID=3457710 RepID=UPI00403491BD
MNPPRPGGAVIGGEGSEIPSEAAASCAELVVRAAIDAGLTLATAESLTAGALVARLVDVPGASGCIAGGAACYSYAAKTRVLGVDAALLERTGAVTAEVATAMALGALRAYGSDVAVSTTGVAGPGPDARGVPAGTVFLAAVTADGAPTRVRELHLGGGRAAVRAGAVEAGIALLAEALGPAGPTPSR